MKKSTQLIALIVLAISPMLGFARTVYLISPISEETITQYDVLATYQLFQNGKTVSTNFTIFPTTMGKRKIASLDIPDDVNIRVTEFSIGGGDGKGNYSVRLGAYPTSKSCWISGDSTGDVFNALKFEIVNDQMLCTQASLP